MSPSALDKNTLQSVQVQVGNDSNAHFTKCLYEPTRKSYHVKCT